MKDYDDSVSLFTIFVLIVIGLGLALIPYWLILGR